jgi:hypothetical protein
MSTHKIIRKNFEIKFFFHNTNDMCDHIDKKIKSLKMQNYNFSKSNNTDYSIIASCKEYIIGVDMENSCRNLSKALKKIICKNNQGLNLRPIELWTLMESSYKCINTDNHFTQYTFTEMDGWYMSVNNNKKIFSQVLNYRDKCIAVSIHGENISRNDLN